MYFIVWIECGKILSAMVRGDRKVRQMIGDLKDKGVKKIAIDGKEIK